MKKNIIIFILALICIPVFAVENTIIKTEAGLSLKLPMGLEHPVYSATAALSVNKGLFEFKAEANVGATLKTDPLYTTLLSTLQFPGFFGAPELPIEQDATLRASFNTLFCLVLKAKNNLSFNLGVGPGVTFTDGFEEKMHTIETPFMPYFELYFEAGLEKSFKENRYLSFDLGYNMVFQHKYTDGFANSYLETRICYGKSF